MEEAPIDVVCMATATANCDFKPTKFQRCVVLITAQCNCSC